MIEQLISFETAKLANKKGFYGKPLKSFPTSRKHLYVSNITPIQSLLQKWLREVHKTDIIISIFLDMYIVSVYRYNKILPIYENDSMKKFTKYEDALEAGLQQGLKLIK